MGRDDRIAFVGTEREVAHHAAPLRGLFDVRIVAADEVEEADCDLFVFFNEFFTRFRAAVESLRRRGKPTLYALDGILEWRNSWEFPPTISCLWTMKPILSDKVACIGRSQARLLESWGNLGKCEVTGVPRFDRLLGRAPRRRRAGEPLVVLIMTAKSPGFTAQQIERARRGLMDLKDWLTIHSIVGGTEIRPRWRVTAGLAEQIGVPNHLRDTTGDDLAAALEQVDAVVTTPSTSMLEGMLQGVPVALLDYNNCPHYVPAAWTITAREHFDQVIPELVEPPEAKLLHQDTILRDALECREPAAPRMARLVEEMIRLARACRSRGEPLKFPRRILPDEQDGHHFPEERFDLRRLYPDHEVFANLDRTALQVELGHLRGEHQRLRRQLEEARHHLKIAEETVEAQPEEPPPLYRRVLRRFHRGAA